MSDERSLKSTAELAYRSRGSLTVTGDFSVGQFDYSYNPESGGSLRWTSRFWRRLKHAWRSGLSYRWSLLVSAVFALAFASQALASTLSASDLRLIERFEAESGQSFAEFFTKIVHQMEICAGQVGACERKLNKRMRGYDLIMNGQSRIPDPAWREISKTALIRTLLDLVETTGLKPHNGISPATQHYILLIFVDRASFDADPEGYLYPQIILPQFGDVEWREHMFRWFLSSDIPCMVLSKDFDEGAIGDAHIWIKNDIPKELVTKCVAEEFFNSFGLDEGDDVPSIFDWPLSDISERDGLSALHLLLLKLLYRPEFEPGQSKEETLQDIQHILSR